MKTVKMELPDLIM